MRTKLTPRQREVLELFPLSGDPPTIRELAVRLGVRSTCTVWTHLTALEAKGYLARRGERSRAQYALTLKGRTVLGAGPPAPEIEDADERARIAAEHYLQQRRQTILREGMASGIVFVLRRIRTVTLPYAVEREIETTLARLVSGEVRDVAA